MEELSVVVASDDLTEEELEVIKDAIARQKEQEQIQLEKLGLTIAKMRSEAIIGRESSGIEQDWAEDEDAYEGLDDANRDSEYRGKSRKPSSVDGQFGIKQREINRSTVLMNITRPYVDAASARVGDMLLPTDDRPWQLKVTPLPDEIEEHWQQIEAVKQQEQNLSMQSDAISPPQQQDTQLTYDEFKAQANKKLKKAEQKIEDYLVECQYHNEVRKTIEDCARIGTGILKGPFPKFKNGELLPASKRIDPWNLYPDPSCVDDIQKGSYVFERDVFSSRQLKELMNNDTYLPEQIERVLDEGPGKRNIVNQHRQQNTSESDNFEIWYFTGDVSLKDLEICGCKVESEHETIRATLTIVNDTVIHAAEMSVDSNDYPYDVICWQKRKDFWAGIGVARQMRTPQRILTAATRAMMDNAGVASGPMFAYKEGIVKPVNGVHEVKPLKFWKVAEEADLREVGGALQSITVPMMQPELMAIVQYAIKMAEDSTGLPQLMQGSQGAAPDTVGGMTMLNNNANTVLRRIARNFDDYITEPHIRRYYQWLKTYEKLEGQYTIDARGSSALVERDIQNQAILQMGQMVLNPAFGIDPAKWMEEWLKAQKFDPKRFQSNQDAADPEKAHLQQQVMQLQQQVQSNQQDTQIKMQIKQMELQAMMQKVQLENQQKERNLLLEIASRENITLAQLKKELQLQKMKEQDTQLDKALKMQDVKIKANDSATKRMAENTRTTEMQYKIRTGNQGI